MNFRKRPVTTLNEINQYIADLEKITKLRDKSAEAALKHPQDHVAEQEWGRYDVTIECMQLVLVSLNETINLQYKT